MAEPTSISLITVTHNSNDQLAAYWADRPRSPEVEWIVADNASSDTSAVTAEQFGAKVIRLPQNHGFAEANNVAAQNAAGSIFVFCNPDVKVTGTGVAELARLTLENQAIVAPQLINPNGTLQPNGRGMPYLHRKILNKCGVRSTGYLRMAPRNHLQPVVWATGAALAIHRADFHRIGGWDAKYFLYHEDIDLCLRARSHGIGTLLAGTVRWIHGWQRASRSADLSAWRSELRSARQFYGTHPSALAPVSAKSRQLDRSPLPAHQTGDRRAI